MDQKTLVQGKKDQQATSVKESNFSDFSIANAGFTVDERLEVLETLVRTFSLLKATVSTAPTYTPKNFYESIVYYVNGSTHRVYFYTTGWHYVTLT